MAKKKGRKVKRSENRKRRGRGEQSIYQRESDGLFVGSISLGYRSDGRRRRVVVYGEDKNAVMAKLEEKRKEVPKILERGEERARMTVGDLVTEWLRLSKLTTAARTHEERTRTARSAILPRLGGLSLAKFKTLQVKTFYLDMVNEKVAASTARHAGQCLSAALQYGVENGDLDANPAAKAGLPPEPQREMLCLDAAQMGLLLAEASKWPAGPLIALAAHSGLRQSELLGLQWGDLDLAAGTVSVQRALTWTKADGFALKPPKTKSSRRTVALPRVAVATMSEYRDRQKKAGLLRSPVFCTKTGEHVFRGNVSRSLKAVLDRINDPRDRKGGRPKADAPPLPPRERLDLVPDALRFHDLRHSHASILISQGASLRAVSQRLGHSNPAFTLRIYAHCLPGDDAQLAGTLDRLFG